MIIVYFLFVITVAFFQYYAYTYQRDVELWILFELFLTKILLLILFTWLTLICLYKNIYGVSFNDTHRYIDSLGYMSSNLFDIKNSLFRLASHGSAFEPLYVLLMQVWYSIVSHNGLYFVAFITIGSILFTFKFFRNNTQLYWVAILLYSSHFLWVKDFNQLRNAMASSVVWYLPAMWYGKKLYKFTFFLLIALSLQSASIFILFAVIFSKYFSKYFLTIKSFVVLLFISVLLYFSHLGDFILINVFAKMSNHIAAYLLLNDEIADRGIFTNPVVIKGILYSLLFIKYRDLITKEHQMNDKFINIYIAGVIWLIVFSGIGIFANRMASYVMGFENFLLAEMLVVNKSSLLFVIIIIIAISQFYVDYSSMLVPQM